MHSQASKYSWLIILLVCSTAFGANINDILNRAEQAERHVSYRGIKQVIVRSGNGKPLSAKMKVLHIKPDKNRTEYLAPSALAGVVFVRTSRGSCQYDPHEKLWKATPHCSVQCDDQVSENLLRHYLVRLEGTKQIADREAYLVTAFPRHKGEPSHRFWIDKQTYLVVGSETIAGDGTLLRSYRFVSLELNPKDVNPSLFDVRASIKSSSERNTRLNFRVRKPSYLPVGYKLVDARTSHINGQPCSHLRFSNGVNTISLFQRRAEKNSGRSAFVVRATNVVSWTKDGMLFTLLGDLSRPELERIARSVK
ncbi:MAG: sigma-E factor regulatory protein RseB domain-containing protein [Armatimonadota bacterium]|nr:sigma-E factor regulatory protein RseB domain-containing protein [Armatimonadota bacterium]